jgi:hypothetical protein
MVPAVPIVPVVQIVSDSTPPTLMLPLYPRGSLRLFIGNSEKGGKVLLPYARCGFTFAFLIFTF